MLSCESTFIIGEAKRGMTKIINRIFLISKSYWKFTANAIQDILGYSNKTVKDL